MARFFRRGKTQFVFTTAGTTVAMTVGNITSGTNLSSYIGDISGFTFANNPIDVPNLASPFTPKIPGPDEADDSTLTVNRDSVPASNVTDALLAKDNLGNIVIGDYKVLGTWGAGEIGRTNV